MEQRILGYSYFPLFIDLESKMPVLAQDRTKHIKRTLHVGNYQMPILAQEPAQRKGSTKLISYRDYVELERLPTASVLLRVDHATVDEKGRFVSINDKDRKAREQAYIPPPEYRSGEYSNAYYLLTEDERDLFALRKHRDIDRPLPELMKQICDA
jgi:hypothetical protein